jgi:hypothetical protein
VIQTDHFGVKRDLDGARVPPLHDGAVLAGGDVAA